MKNFNIYQLFSFLFLLFVTFSCSEMEDLFVLEGEDPKDIVVFQLDNEYLASEAHDYIELFYPTTILDKSYIVVGLKSFGFEAVLDNTESLSFDEDGTHKYNRKEKSTKENLKNGKNGKCDSKCKHRDKIEEVKMTDLHASIIEYLDKEYLDSMYNGSYVLDSVAKAGKFSIDKDKNGTKETVFVVRLRGVKGVFYFNDKGEFLKKDDHKFKRHCKKIRHLDLLKSIKTYIENNHPTHVVTHARKVRTKDGDIIFIVKLISRDKKESIVLKFDKDGNLIV